MLNPGIENVVGIAVRSFNAILIRVSVMSVIDPVLDVLVLYNLACSRLYWH